MKGRGKFMFTKNDELKAIYATDLDSFLEKTGLSNSFHSGGVKCRYCSAKITKENLYALVPNNNSIEFCCNQPECILTPAEEAKK